MELHQLRTFRTVATLQSFSQAAEVLNYSQSTVSEHVKALENDLKVRLFDRLGRRIALTEAGELLLQHAQQMLDIVDEIRSEITDQTEPQGSLSIRIPETVSTYYLPPVLKTFRQRYPRVSFNFNSCTYYSLQQELQSGLTNLAFLITSEEFRASGLEVERLLTLPLVIVTHPENPLASRPGVRAQDMQDVPILLPWGDCSYRMGFERTLAEEKIEPSVVLNFNSIEAAKECIMAGMGITLIPEIAVRKEIAQGLLSAPPWSGKDIRADLLMIWRKNRWISPILNAFMDTIREKIGAQGNEPMSEATADCSSSD